MSYLRRLWWWTLPYYGWTGHSEDEEGAVPAPWYAFPLSWLYRLIDFTVFRRRDVFGPRYSRDQLRVNAPRWKPWQ